MRVLFTGYAPVHFVCFRPLFERLIAEGEEVVLSGGLRRRDPGGAGWRYDLAGLYSPFGIAPERLRPLSQVGDEEFDLLFAANTEMLRPRRVGATVQIFHGISFRNKAVRPANASADYYFMIGPYMRRRFAEAGIISEGDPRAVEVGFMKTDRLLNGTLDRASLLDRYGLSGTRPVVLYAPTGQRHNSLETMGEEVIRRIDATGEVDLLVKLHDHPKNQTVDWPSRLAPLQSERTRVVGDPDVIPLLFLADLLVSDASSVTSEFSLLDRPMVFLDVPKLLAMARRSADSAVDLDTWGRRCGVIVERPDDVVGAVLGELEHPERLSEVRLEMAEDLFYNPGLATEVARHWVCEAFAAVR